MNKYNYAENQPVAFNYGGVSGYGTVLGVATTELPILGCYYMIRTQTCNKGLPNDTYPFKTISMPEIGMVDLKLGDYNAVDISKGYTESTIEIKVDGEIIILIKSMYLEVMKTMPEPERSNHVEEWANAMMQSKEFPEKIQFEHLHQFLRHISLCK